MRNFGLMFLISFTVIASGCTSNSLPQDPSEGFKEFREQRSDSKYHVKYSFTSDTPEGEIREGFEPAILRFNNFRIFGLKTSGSNSLTSYKVGEEEILCELNSNGRSCSRVEPDYISKLLLNPQPQNISYSGSKEVLGRECQSFTSSSLGLERFESSEGNINLSLCLDREKGYTSLLELHISNGQENATLRYEAESYNHEITRDSFDVPNQIENLEDYELEDKK